LGAQKVVWTTGAKLRQTGCVVRINETQDLLVVRDGTDDALLLANLSAQPRQDCRKGFAPPRFVQRLVFLSAESLSVPAFFLVSGLDVFGSLLNKRERQVVAFLVVIGPVDQAVLPQDCTSRLRMLLPDVLQYQAQLEARSQPGRPDHFFTVDLFSQLLRVFRRRDRDGRVRVHVVHVFKRDEGMQRGVDRRGPRVKVKSRVCEHANHLVFGRRLGSFLRLLSVKPLQRDTLGLVQRREILAHARAQVATGAFYPERFDFLAR